MDGPHFIFAGGGTGGHLYPGLAVAEAVRAMCPPARITFLTTDRPLDRDLLGRTTFGQVAQPVRPFSARPWDWPAFLLAWRRSVAAAKELMLRERPTAVLGLGGYAAGPAVAAARGLRVRSAILNPDAVPGRANRYLASRTDLVVLQWAASRRHFAEATPCGVLGCPIRREFADAAAQAVAGSLDVGAARRRFGLHESRPVVLVTGASQGARTVNQAVQQVWRAFLQRHPEWQLLHLAGAADADAARTAYAAVAHVTASAAREGDARADGATGANAAGSGEPRREDGALNDAAAIRVESFVHDMWLAIAAADMVVSRAGASTLAELTALGKPSILLPYPYHRDMHQTANARVLVNAGAALLIDDARDAAANSPPLLAALERMADRSVREQMAIRARGLGLPRAAESVARWLTGSIT